MEDQSDIRWLLRQCVEVFSWTGIGWFVALLLGIWGAMIGIGAFVPAYVSLILSLCLCSFKWAHATQILHRKKRVAAFVLGMLVLIGMGVGTAMWTHERRVQAVEDAKKLEPLKDIPQIRL